MKTISELTGKGWINHPAYRVRTGMLNAAVEFFTGQLGWVEEIDKRVTGDWGEARFVKPRLDYPVSIQLTEDLSQSPDLLVTYPGSHLGITIGDAYQSAQCAVRWATLGGLSKAHKYAANLKGDKWFFEVKELFTFEIEFVSYSCLHTPCKFCEGEGEVITGQEGKGFHFTCSHCAGTGLET